MDSSESEAVSDDSETLCRRLINPAIGNKNNRAMSTTLTVTHNSVHERTRTDLVPWAATPGILSPCSSDGMESRSALMAPTTIETSSTRRREGLTRLRIGLILPLAHTDTQTHMHSTFAEGVSRALQQSPQQLDLNE